VGTAKAVRAVRAREKASMTRATAWLEELGVGQYAQVFCQAIHRFPTLIARAEEVIE
jgi:hypothetical protein